MFGIRYIKITSAGKHAALNSIAPPSESKETNLKITHKLVRKKLKYSAKNF